MISFNDKIQNILTNKQSVSLRFLSSYEQTIIQPLTTLYDIRLYGGYQGAERKRAYFYKDATDDITCFQIIYPKKHLTLTHQNILGTLLSLSITKDSIGDILPKQGVFFLTSEIKDEVLRTFDTINHVPIELIEIDSNTVHPEQEFKEMQIITDSLRLDLIVSKLTTLSRNESAEIIDKEFVKINQVISSKQTKQLQVEDVLSIRGFGRFVIDDTSLRTRKHKIVVKVRKFI